jgi:hypothetical protein
MQEMRSGFHGYGKGKLAILCLLVCAFALGQSCLADEYYDEGVKRYTKKDYRGCIPYFEQSLTISPWESNTYYYCALAYQQAGMWEKAKEKYETLIEKFPGTPAANNATAVIKRLDPSYFNKRPAAGGGDATTASVDSGTKAQDDPLAGVVVSGPATSRVALERANDNMIVSGSINNRTVKMYIGGDATTISRKDLGALGIQAPKGTGTREAGQSTPSWKIRGQVRVGDISQSNFPITINDTADHPTLGNDFFSKVGYTVDNRANTMTLTRKDGAAARSAGGYEVPFTKSGSDMMVNVTVNGRSCSMIFDDKGSECVVPKRRAREFGLEVNETSVTNMYNPGSNPTGAIRGEAGFGDQKVEASADASIRLGPISKSGVHFKLDDAARQAKLGSSAFGDWQYTIDSQANVIRFKR